MSRDSSAPWYSNRVIIVPLYLGSPSPETAGFSHDSPMPMYEGNMIKKYQRRVKSLSSAVGLLVDGVVNDIAERVLLLLFTNHGSTERHGSVYSPLHIYTI